MRISDWSSDVCSSDLLRLDLRRRRGGARLCLDILADDRGQPRGNDPLLLGRDQRLCDPHPPYQDTNDQKARDDLNGREARENSALRCGRRVGRRGRQVESAEERRVGKEWGGKGRSWG